MKNTKIIPNKLSGCGELFVDASSVNEIWVAYPSVHLLLQNGRRHELKPDRERSLTAATSVTELLFTTDQREQMIALAGTMGHSINVENIQRIAHQGGVLVAEMKDGTTIFSKRPQSFNDFQQAFAIVFGQEAADQLKPQIPEPILLEKKPVPPARKPAATVAAWYEGLTNVADIPQPLSAPPVPRITTTNALARGGAISGVVESLELIVVDVAARAAYSGRDGDVAAALTSRLRDLRMAQLRLASLDTSDNLAAVIRCAGEVRSSTLRLPKDAAAQASHSKIVEFCKVLEEMPGIHTAA